MQGEPRWASRIYVGQVVHRRRAPFEHEFRYRLFQVLLDLDEIPQLLSGSWLTSAARPAIARFRRDDHLGPTDRTLSDCVRDLVEESTGRRPQGSIRLLTHLRYFGYVMNPVSFYYCYGPENHDLQAVVAEVHNTPWGERHCYVLPWGADESGRCRLEHAKQFHVSPFLPMDHSYRWTLTAPELNTAESVLNVRIENRREGETIHEAVLTLQARPWSQRSLAACLLRFPWMTAKVTTAIYWQALRLWWKGATFYPHPGSGAAKSAGVNSAIASPPPGDLTEPTKSLAEPLTTKAFSESGSH